MIKLHCISFELSKSNWMASFGDKVFELIFETEVEGITECNVFVNGVHRVKFKVCGIFRNRPCLFQFV
jgi:hypothetical protein